MVTQHILRTNAGKYVFLERKKNLICDCCRSKHMTSYGRNYFRVTVSHKYHGPMRNHLIKESCGCMSSVFVLIFSNQVPPNHRECNPVQNRGKCNALSFGQSGHRLERGFVSIQSRFLVRILGFRIPLGCTRIQIRPLRGRKNRIRIRPSKK